MSIENNLPELRRKYQTSQDVLNEVRSRWETRERELNQEARLKLRTEMGDEYQRKQLEFNQADKELRTEEERVQLAAGVAALPYPEGTVLVEWLSSSWLAEGEPSFYKTGKKGVVELHRSSDPRPDNQRYAHLIAGEVVVRYLLANGKPGKVAVRYAPRHWKPEGEVHERCKLRSCYSCQKDRPADGDQKHRFAEGSICPHCGAVESYK